MLGFDLPPLRGARTAYERGVVTLTCIECGETSEEGDGWKAELAVDLLDEEEPDEVALLLPGGSLREFSDA